jgi:hypothetical protein
MTITQISAAKYMAQDNSVIDMVVTDDALGAFPFTYSPNDDTPTAKQVRALIEQGGLKITPYVAPEVTNPVPAAITPRQFLLAMVGAQMITPQEAIAAAQTGTPPAFIAAYFDTLSPEMNKTAAYITFAKMSVVERTHPLVTALGELQKLTSEQIDDYFRQAATL